MDISIVRIPLHDVKDFPERFNSNNHDLDELPDNSPEKALTANGQYAAIRSETACSRWVSLRFSSSHEYICVPLTMRECMVLREYSRIGQATMHYPSDDDDLMPIIDKIDRGIAGQVGVTPPFFARLEGVSTKDGVNGPGPFFTGKEVVKAIVTSLRCYREFDGNPGGANSVYLFPWRADLDTDREFRAFVSNTRVTAISQYSWTRESIWSDPTQDAALRAIAADIVRLVERILAKHPDIFIPRSFVLDVAALSSGVELIELNAFGAQLSAGSGLFHWIKDLDLLYGASLKGSNAENRIELRIVSC
ncbi:hypothetical protein DFJ77DRAFT_439263 [Powellomyces hirtus]|nr:hypothetical protein DFJ77DRAFT_439263 [Powellomyces hirtus]